MIDENEASDVFNSTIQLNLQGVIYLPYQDIISWGDGWVQRADGSYIMVSQNAIQIKSLIEMKCAQENEFNKNSEEGQDGGFL